MSSFNIMFPGRRAHSFAIVTNDALLAIVGGAGAISRKMSTAPACVASFFLLK